MHFVLGSLKLPLWRCCIPGYGCTRMLTEQVEKWVLPAEGSPAPFCPEMHYVQQSYPNGINAGGFPMHSQMSLVLSHSSWLSACIYDHPTLCVCVCVCLGFIVPLKQDSQYQTKVSMTDGSKVGCSESILCIAKKACLSCAPYHALEVSAFCHLT